MGFDGKEVVFQKRYDALESDYMKRFAKHLWDWVQYCQDARRPREQVIRECDEAYLCVNYVPDTGGIALLETGEFGDTDIFDNVRMKSARTAVTLMPRGERWIVAAGWDNENPDVIRGIEEHQTWRHHVNRTRRQLQRHFAQKEVRGRSGIWWEWDETIIWKRLASKDQEKALTWFTRKMGLSPAAAKKLGSGRFPYQKSAGPIIQPIDWYDLWLDPLADLVVNRNPAKIIRRFYTVEKLKSLVDPVTEEKLFTIPDGFEATDVNEIISDREQSGDRQATSRLLGYHLPIAGEHFQRSLVPVYIVYMPYIEFDGDHFYDTFFYLAKSGNGDTPLLIRVEENPSDLGHNHILIDDHIDWFTPTAGGGISSVEKLIAHYRHKCLIKLLTITGAAHSVFPPYLSRSGAFRDASQINFLPGGLTLTDFEGPLADTIVPMPTPLQGVQLGEQLLRFMADEIRATSGVDGLITDNASRSLSKGKTATQVRHEESSGSLLLDNQAENDIELLNDLINATWEAEQAMLMPNATVNGGAEGAMQYEKFLGDQVRMGLVSEADFRKPRGLHVFGQTGSFSKRQRLNDILQGLDVAGLVSQTLGPQIAPFVYKGFLAAWQMLGIGMPDGVTGTPEEIIAANPAVQQTVIEQTLQANPEIAQILQQGGLLGQPQQPQQQPAAF